MTVIVKIGTDLTVTEASKIELLHFQSGYRFMAVASKILYVGNISKTEYNQVIMNGASTSVFNFGDYACAEIKEGDEKNEGYYNWYMTYKQDFEPQCEEEMELADYLDEAEDEGDEPTVSLIGEQIGSGIDDLVLEDYVGDIDVDDAMLRIDAIIGEHNAGVDTDKIKEEFDSEEESDTDEIIDMYNYLSEGDSDEVYEGEY